MARTVRQKAVARARAKEKALIKGARLDPAKFVEYALPHEKTGEPITNAPFHKDWQQHFSDHDYCLLIAPVEHGKSVQLAVGRILWELGNDSSIRIALISNTEGMASKIVSAIRTHIERNPRVRKVFPDLKPSEYKEHPWHNTKITIARESIARDPSVQALGAYGPIVGSRIDIVLMDDILDFDNTRTSEARKKLVEWFDTTVFTRVTDGGKCWSIGTPWNPSDLLHDLEGRPDFYAKRYCAVHNPEAPEEEWKPIWPEQWSLERLLMKRRNMGIMDFVRKYLCQVRDDKNARFRKDWIKGALKLGAGFSMVTQQPKLVTGQMMRCFTGVDLGVGQDEDHDLTVLYTLGIDHRNRKRTLNIQKGRWQSPEILQRLWNVYRRFDSIIYVESNGAQRFILQFAGAQGLPCLPFNTDGNKWDPAFGVEGIAVEMQSGLHVWPSGPTGHEIHPELIDLEQACLFFTAQKNAHTADELMAYWFANTAANDFLKDRVEDVDILAR